MAPAGSKKAREGGDMFMGGVGFCQSEEMDSSGRSVDINVKFMLQLINSQL